MVSRSRHPKKDVEEALQRAEAAGWTVTVKSSKGHAWGMLTCGKGCIISVWSTPKNAQNHAKALDRKVRNDPHKKKPGGGE